MSVQDDLDPSIVGFEFIKEGSDWLAIFNPNVPRQMDVRLTSRFTHEKYVPFYVNSTLLTIDNRNYIFEGLCAVLNFPWMPNYWPWDQMASYYCMIWLQTKSSRTNRGA